MSLDSQLIDRFGSVVPTLVLWGILALAPGVRAQPPDAEQVVTATRVKATFLHHLPAYISWPPTERREKGDRTLCILGEDRLWKVLADLGRNLPSGKNMTIRHLRHLSPEIRECSMVFLDRDLGLPLSHVLGVLAGTRALTISDRPGFAQSGGMIELFSEKNRLRFAINVPAVRNAGFTVDPQILALSRIVPEDAFSYARIPAERK